jgi:hypothetical protein
MPVAGTRPIDCGGRPSGSIHSSRARSRGIAGRRPLDGQEAAAPLGGGDERRLGVRAGQARRRHSRTAARVATGGRLPAQKRARNRRPPILATGPGSTTRALRRCQAHYRQR